MKADKMKDTIIYIRTSTEEQTPGLQLKDCESLALKLGLKDYEVCPEQKSAFKDNVDRKVFDSIKKAIGEGKVSRLIVWDLDRIYRNRKKLIAFFELCRIYGCRIYSFRQEWLENLNKMPPPFNEIMHGLMLQIMGWLAEDDSKRKSMRVKNAVRREGGITRSYNGRKWGRKTILSDKLRNTAVELRKQGLSLGKIAEQMHISKTSVFKLLSRNTEAKQSQNFEVIN